MGSIMHLHTLRKLTVLELYLRQPLSGKGKGRSGGKAKAWDGRTSSK